MAKDNIATNEVSKNAPIFLAVGQYELADLDPLFARILGSGKFSGYGAAGLFGSGDGLGNWGGSSGTGTGTGTGPGGTLTVPQGPGKPFFPEVTLTFDYPAPDLSSIEIYKQEMNYSTNPPTVDITFRVRNTTGYPVVGLNAKVPKQ